MTEVETCLLPASQLGSLIGVASCKGEIRSLHNRLEVGRKRAAFGVVDERPLHTLLVGSKGMDFEVGQAARGAARHARAEWVAVTCGRVRRCASQRRRSQEAGADPREAGARERPALVRGRRS